MMEGRDGGDAIKMRSGKLSLHHVGNFEFDLGKLGRSETRYANHFRRKIDSGHVPGPIREGPRESAGAAANLQDVFTFRRNTPQQKFVIVIVAGPTLLVELREAIEVSFNGGQSSASISASPRGLGMLNSARSGASC